MANLANLIFSETFEGVLGADWPLVFGSGNPPFSKPRLDGKGHGIGSLAMGAGTWRGKSTGYPGRSNYKVDLWGRWKNPGFSGGRGVGLLFRMKDYQNTLCARLTSQGTSNPTLELLKIVGGSPTVLGTYSGAGLGSSKLISGVRWRARVEDLENGDTSVRVYTDPLGAGGDGDLRIDYTGDLSAFRGLFGVGVELTTLVYNDDAKVDDLEVYDFADEWQPTAPSGPLGTGWQVEIDGVLYDVTSEGGDGFRPGAVGHLEGTDPPVFLEEVRHGYGPNGNLATLKTAGVFHGGIVRPNSLVVVYYNGTTEFRGRVAKGKQTGNAGSEVQTWTCRDAFWLARDVYLEEDDGAGTHTFNVTDEEDERYDPDRLEMTLGDVLKWHFDRYVDSDYGLRFYGAAPPTGTPYVLAELANLTAVVPNLTTSNNFAAAVDQILGFMPRYQVFVDPDDQVWHFRDVTTLTGETVSFDAEWAEVEIEPDPSRSYTRVLYRGAKKGEDEDSVLEFSTNANTLEKGWTQAQEDNFDPDKRHRTEWVNLTVLAAANYGLPLPPDVPPGSLCYVDVAASEGLDPDDLRGGLAGGLDAFPRFVTGNTSTRIHLGSPLFPTPPAPGERFGVTLLSEGAQAELAAMGVGTVYLLPPVQICASSGAAYKYGARQGGFCGTATVEYTKDGRVYSQEYAAKVHMMHAQAQAAGHCQPTVQLSERPKPPVGLVNYLPPAGSLPPTQCEPGEPRDLPQVAVKFRLRKYDEKAPQIVIPATGFSGDAFDEWGVERTFVFDDPEFVDEAMIADLTPAAQAIHDVYSQRTFFFSVRLATPWGAQAPQIPTVVDPVSRFGRLFKAIRLSSTRRSMPDYEAPSSFPTFEVAWNIRQRTTTLRAGTAAGWLAFDARVLTRGLREAAVEKKIAAAIRTLEDFRNRLIEKEHAVPQQPAGMIPGCQVEVVDKEVRRVVSVQKKHEDDQKIVKGIAATMRGVEDLLLGEDSVIPGAPVEVPGLPGGYPVEGQDRVLGQPIADPRLPMGGADDSIVNATTSRYGGVPGVDGSGYGAPPNHVFRRGGLAFRIRTNANGQPTGIQAAPLGPGGAIPAGPWTTIRKPRDVLDALGKPPERIAGGESIVGRLVRTDDDLLGALNRHRHDDEGLPVPPGSETPSFPDGTPADLSSHLRAAYAQNLEIVRETWEDPGGPVFEGPIGSLGQSAGMFWRVLVPENLLVRVTKVGPGSGTNGGAWAWDTSGPGGLLEYLRTGRVVRLHKQASDFEDVSDSFGGAPGQTSAYAGPDPGHPWGVAGSRWDMVSGPAVTTAAVAATFALPKGSVGSLAIEVHVRENPSNPLNLGGTWTFDVLTTRSGSPWSAPANQGSGQVTGDGAGNGQGVFLGPGDAVPPGLRQPFGPDYSVAVNGTGLGTATSGTILVSGIDVEVLVVEGGYLLRASEDLTIGEEVLIGDVSEIENLEISDAVSFEVQKGLEESLTIHDGVSLEVNPPISLEEVLSIEDEVTTLVL